MIIGNNKSSSILVRPTGVKNDIEMPLIEKVG